MQNGEQCTVQAPALGMMMTTFFLKDGRSTAKLFEKEF
jgi:hypothetical protein